MLPVMPAAPRCTSAKAPKVTTSSSGTPARELTCAEMRMMCPSTTAMKSTAVRCRKSVTGIPCKAVLIDRNLSQQVEVREHLAGAQHDRRQRIFSHREWQAGFFPQALVEVL